MIRTEDLVYLIAINAYATWTATLIGNAHPSTKALYLRMRNPQIGDLVLETSTIHREPWDPGALGRLVGVSKEVWGEAEDWSSGEQPTEQVWYLEPFLPTKDGKTEVRWCNADFIAIPDSLRWDA